MSESFNWMNKCFLTLIVLGIFLLKSRAVETIQSNPSLQQITADIFQLGQVRLDKKLKTIQFPAELNMTNGLIEYLLVTTKGKTHESLLKTEVEPYQIHLAMLLIGAKRAPTAPDQQPAANPFHVNQPGVRRPVIPGDPFTIQLTYEDKTIPAENYITDLSTKKNASPSPWNYNGSRVVNGAFLAQGQGSIVAMVDDLDAMANNPRPDHDNDQIWQINTNHLPPMKTPITVTFKLETNK